MVAAALPQSAMHGTHGAGNILIPALAIFHRMTGYLLLTNNLSMSCKMQHAFFQFGVIQGCVWTLVS